jgi:hypothetical protein
VPRFGSLRELVIVDRDSKHHLTGATTLLSMARKWLELADKEPPMDDRLETQLPEFNRRQLLCDPDL